MVNGKTKPKKKTTADQMPNLANATPEFLVDELGDVRAQIKELTKMEGFYKAALKARMGYDEMILGEKYKGIKTQKTRSGLDSKKIREDMDPEWIQEHSTSTDYDQIDTPLREMDNGR